LSFWDKFGTAKKSAHTLELNLRVSLQLQSQTYPHSQNKKIRFRTYLGHKTGFRPRTTEKWLQIIIWSP